MRLGYPFRRGTSLARRPGPKYRLTRAVPRPRVRGTPHGRLCIGYRRPRRSTGGADRLRRRPSAGARRRDLPRRPERQAARPESQPVRGQAASRLAERPASRVRQRARPRNEDLRRRDRRTRLAHRVVRAADRGGAGARRMVARRHAPRGDSGHGRTDARLRPPAGPAAARRRAGAECQRVDRRGVVVSRRSRACVPDPHLRSSEPHSPRSRRRRPRRDACDVSCRRVCVVARGRAHGKRREAPIDRPRWRRARAGDPARVVARRDRALLGRREPTRSVQDRPARRAADACGDRGSERPLLEAVRAARFCAPLRMRVARRLAHRGDGQGRGRFRGAGRAGRRQRRADAARGSRLHGRQRHGRRRDLAPVRRCWAPRLPELLPGAASTSMRSM